MVKASLWESAGLMFKDSQAQHTHIETNTVHHIWHSSKNPLVSDLHPSSFFIFLLFLVCGGLQSSKSSQSRRVRWGQLDLFLRSWKFKVIPKRGESFKIKKLSPVGPTSTLLLLFVCLFTLQLSVTWFQRHINKCLPIPLFKTKTIIYYLKKDQKAALDKPRQDKTRQGATIVTLEFKGGGLPLWIAIGVVNSRMTRNSQSSHRCAARQVIHHRAD